MEARIQRLDRWTVRYERDGRVVTIPAEGSAEGEILALFVKDIAYWDAPHDAVAVTAEELNGMKVELEAAFAAEDVRVEFDPVD